MPDLFLSEAEDGVYLKVRVKPKSKSREFIAGIENEALVINLKSPAREGKANTELLRRISKILGVSTGDLTIIAGHKSREKTIQVHRVELEYVLKAIEAFTNDK
jgi:uncharacterized protein (TIGR00251 family)